MKTRSALGAVALRAVALRAVALRAVALLAAGTLLVSQPLGAAGAAGKDQLDFSGKWNGAHSKLVKLYDPIWEEPFGEGWVRQPKGTVKEHGKEKHGTVIVSSGFTWDRVIIYENRINKGGLQRSGFCLLDLDGDFWPEDLVRLCVSAEGDDQSRGAMHVPSGPVYG